MSEYPNSGILGKNKRMREGKNDPPYSGTCEVNGVEFWLAAWVKESKKDGSKFFSLSFTPKEAKAPQAEPKQDDDQEIPF